MLAARVAQADTPGAPDDALAPVVDQALAVRTPGGFSLEGSEGVTYLDGFATPMFYRDGRSALSIGGDPPRLVEDAEAGDAAGSRIDATTPHGFTGAELSSALVELALDATEPRVHASATARFSFASIERGYVDRRDSLDLPPLQYDAAAELRVYHSRHLDVDLHLFEFLEGQSAWLDGTETEDHHVEQSNGAARVTALIRYHAGPWTIRLDRSFELEVVKSERGLVQHAKASALRFESRDEVRRSYDHAGGLSQVEWISGLETRISQYERDVAGPFEPRENVARAGDLPLDDISHAYKATLWRPDLAISTGMKARLAKRVTAYVGLRLDSFSGDAAFGPRAELAIGCGRLTCRVDAGAYRRPAEEGEELEHPELHPERTTRVALGADNSHGKLRFYYADQTRLIVRDPLGRYANTGRGTTYGAYALVRGHLGKLTTQLALRLEHAERQDAPRLQIRPYEYDQPVRLEARIERAWAGWRVAARFELREGLPYTKVVGAAYDSDRDVYLPTFAPLYAERLPWQHQLALRVDRTWKLGTTVLAAFLDVANVYDHRAAIGYEYNFTFSQRRAIEAFPFWPTLGVRGAL
ncbi:MAG: hypothetical protein ABI678_13620 [Kofleriaceae bacterium]